jgi:hypothetical protein
MKQCIYRVDSCERSSGCSFVVYTQDECGNSRFNYGSSPSFEISIVGSGDWAQEGRINSVIESDGPLEVLSVSSESNNWEYIGQVDATHQSSSLISRVNTLGLLSRGDSIVIDGVMYTISSTGAFDGISIPLSSYYIWEKQSPAFHCTKTAQHVGRGHTHTHTQSNIHQ